MVEWEDKNVFRIIAIVGFLKGLTVNTSGNGFPLQGSTSASVIGVENYPSGSGSRTTCH